MAITSKQRKKLPSSAFALPGQRKYPMPTKSQAKKAGISEAQRVRLGKNALARSTNKRTAGSYPKIAKVARSRFGEKIASTSKSRGTTNKPGTRKKRR